MQPKALLLDLDGTLADTLDLLFGFYSKFLMLCGSQGSRDEFEELNGFAAWEVMEILKQRHSLQPSVDELMGQHRHFLTQLYRQQVELFPDTVDFLQRMKGKGLTVTIVTSCLPEMANGLLHRHQLTEVIDNLVTPEGLLHSKPNPAIYQRALEVTGVAPTEAMVVEDALLGVQAGLAAGIPTVVMVRPGAYRFEMPDGILGQVSSLDELETKFLFGATC